MTQVDISALHWAACNGHADVVRLLLMKGAEVDICHKVCVHYSYNQCKNISSK